MDKKEHVKFDDKEFSPLDIKFLDNNLIVFPEESEGILFKNVSTTIKLCLNKLKNNEKIICPVCRIEATILRRDKSFSPIKNKFHWAFYGIKDNEYILFTKDHIKPRSILEFNEHSTYNLMCECCNTKKGNNFENLSKNKLCKLTLNKKRRNIIYNHLLVPAKRKLSTTINNEKELHKVNKIYQYLINNINEISNNVNSVRKYELIEAQEEINDFEDFFNLTPFQKNIFNTFVKTFDYKKPNKLDCKANELSYRIWKSVKAYQYLLFQNINDIMNIAE